MISASVLVSKFLLEFLPWIVSIMYYDVEIKEEANPSLLPGALVMHSVFHNNRKQTKTAGHLNHFRGSGSITEEEGGRLYE